MFISRKISRWNEDPWGRASRGYCAKKAVKKIAGIRKGGTLACKIVGQTPSSWNYGNLSPLLGKKRGGKKTSEKSRGGI